MSIIRGTTPTITFKVNTDLDLNDIAELWITFKTKPGMMLREKTYTLDDVSIDAQARTIVLVLTQEDTLAFQEPQVLIQTRMRMNDDLAYASGIIETSIGKILKGGVI